MHKLSAAKPSSAVFSIALSFLALISVDGARAQTVVNPSFELPVAGPPLNYIEDPPTTSGVGWEFSGPAGAPNESGVQQNGSAFHAPVTTNGQQTGWILNLGKLSQSINFPKSGDYVLSFKVAAAGAGGAPKEEIQVSLDGPLEKVTPTSTTSFTEVTIAFNTTAGNHTLSFTGAGPLSTGERANVFIDEVAIKFLPPQITSGPGDLDPASKIKLTGSHFGTDKGKFRIHFPSASLVHFAKSSSKDDLDLDVDGAWSDDGTITSEQILTASPVGSVNGQTVDITVIAADGQTSNVWHAKFHNDAVITSGPKIISFVPVVPLNGWDFGQDPGTLTIHFPQRSFVEFTAQNPHSKSDLIVSPSGPEWKPGSMAVAGPPIQGVVEQTVDISITTKDGRESNKWQAKFEPMLALATVPWQDVTVRECSNQGVDNQCNNSFSSGVFTPFCALNAVGFGVDTINAYHDGCFGFDSDDGTDIYFASVKNGWKIISIDNIGTSNDNGSVGGSWNVPTSSITPSWSVTMVAPWHIGALGGYVNYWANITVMGPLGVPFE